MDVELRHHYGWRRYSIPDAVTLEDAAYRAVRQSHDFLTDTNHAHDAGERTSEWAGKPFTFWAVRVYRRDGAPLYSGPSSLETDYWFAVQYRQPTTASAAIPKDGIPSD